MKKRFRIALCLFVSLGIIGLALILVRDFKENSAYQPFLPLPDSAVSITADVYHGLTGDQDIIGLELSQDEYRYVFDQISTSSQSNLTRSDYIVLIKIYVNTNDGAKTTISVYLIGKGALAYSLDESAILHIVLDKEDKVDLAMRLYYYLRSAAKKR